MQKEKIENMIGKIYCEDYFEIINKRLQTVQGSLF